MDDDSTRHDLLFLDMASSPVKPLETEVDELPKRHFSQGGEAKALGMCLFAFLVLALAIFSPSGMWYVAFIPVFAAACVALPIGLAWCIVALCSRWWA